jgi:hypothetical protein
MKMTNWMRVVNLGLGVLSLEVMIVIIGAFCVPRLNKSIEILTTGSGGFHSPPGSHYGGSDNSIPLSQQDSHGGRRYIRSLSPSVGSLFSHTSTTYSDLNHGYCRHCGRDFPDPDSSSSESLVISGSESDHGLDSPPHPGKGKGPITNESSRPFKTGESKKASKSSETKESEADESSKSSKTKEPRTTSKKTDSTSGNKDGSKKHTPETKSPRKK